MIKQINLRGISRSPSDRMMEDGGCSESLNVITDTNEIVSMPAPKDITAECGVPDGFAGEVLYIHTCGGKYRNIIAREGLDIVFFDADGNSGTVCSLNAGDALTAVKSLGNVLIFVVNQGLKCYLFTNGEYESAGDIYVPQVKVSPRIGKGEKLETGLYAQAIKNPEPNVDIAYNINIYKKNLYDYGVDNLRILRVSIVLYDGTEVYGDPILIHSYYNVEDFSFQNYHYLGSPNLEENKVFILQYDLHYNYTDICSYQFCIDKFPYNQNIVTGINIYSSNSFKNYKLSDVQRSDERIKTISFPSNLGPFTGGEIEVGFPEINRNYEDTQLPHTFWKVKSYQFNVEESTEITNQVADISKLLTGDVIEFPTNEELESGCQPIDYEHEYSPAIESVKNIDVYNNRLMTFGAAGVRHLYNFPSAVSHEFEEFYQKKLSDGSVIFSSVVSFEFTFVIVEPVTGERTYVTPKDEDGDSFWYPGSGNAYLGLLFYPDINCKYVYITARYITNRVDSYSYKCRKYEMQTSNVSGYAYCQIDPKLEKGLYALILDYSYGGEAIDYAKVPEDNQKKLLFNKLYVSEMDNPFKFTAGSTFTFEDEIIGIGTTTKALSSGQFGQFPLYVFTKGGIWSMGVGSDGSFVSKHALSRDVALSPDCIIPIEQAIVFTTERGVMLLSGSDIKNISPYMTGKHYMMDDSAKAKLQNDAIFGPLLPAVSDDTPFIDFMRGAKTAYDYTGKRLIFFNPDEVYQYVYKLDTDCWHKMMTGSESEENDKPYLDILYINASKIYVPPREREAYFSACETAQSYIGREIEELCSYGYEITRHSSLASWNPNHLWDMQGWVPLLYVRSDITYGASYVRDFIAKYYSGCTTLEFSKEEDFKWTKLGLGKAYHILNSYPDCWVAGNAEGKARILDLSTSFNVDDVQALPGIIITRPIDFESPDVRKVLKRLRIRGDYQRGNVQYILEASMDGRTWGVIPSLHSGSFKYFRLVILVGMEPFDRLSYIETDIETRFNNKLR